MEESKRRKAIQIGIAVSVGVVALIVFKKMFYDQTQSETMPAHSDRTNTANKENKRKREENKEENEEEFRVKQVKDLEVKEEEEVKKREITSKPIPSKDILSLLNSNNDSFVIIDVRDPNIDFVGGHIAKSVNISSQTFYDKLPEILATYHNKNRFIVQCMYGAHRSIECMDLYKKAISEIIKNYSKQKGSSFYNKYTSKTEKTRIDIKCDGAMYDNLCNQKLYHVEEGFFAFINDPKIDRKNKNVISDFDDKQWTELTVLNEKKLYHKKEFFEANKFQQQGRADIV